MPAFYQRLDLYLNTSLHEGIPISVLEAMSYGIPVIASNVGGMAEILDNAVEGYLIEGRNPKEFAEKCIRLFENKTVKNRMALAGKEKVFKKFSIDQMAQQYRHLYFNKINKNQKYF